MSENLLAKDNYDSVPFNALQPVNTGINATVKNVSNGGYSFWYGFILHNNDSSARWVQVFYKPAASVTLGATAPDFTILIGANESIAWDFYRPIHAKLGLSVAGTTTETGSTGPTAAITGAILHKAKK